MQFPSAEWIDALAAAASADAEELARLGFCNIRLVLRVNATPDGDRCLGLILDGYDIESAGEVDPATWEHDCVLEGPLGAWNDMLTNIAEHDGADLAHTLNALTLAEFPMRVTAGDPIGRDLFYRYNESLQAIFDKAGQVPVDVAAGVA